MSTWVPGCLVTSADGSVQVTPAAGGGTNLSSIKGLYGNVIDSSLNYILPTTTAFANGNGVNIIAAGQTASSLKFLKGATYIVSLPYSFTVGAAAIAVTAANLCQLVVYMTFVTSGSQNPAFPTEGWRVAIPVSSAGTVPAGTVVNGTFTSTLTIEPTYGPVSGAAGYDPNTVTVQPYATFQLLGISAATTAGVQVGSILTTPNTASNTPIVYQRVY